MARLRALTSLERNTHDFTHVWETDYNDLVTSLAAGDTGAVTYTIASNVSTGAAIERAVMDVTTAYGHASTLTLALKLAATDVIAATDIKTAGPTRGDTLVAATAGGDDLTAVITPGAGDAGAATAGALKVFFKFSDPNLMS